jgi:hypothetical protein
MGYVFGSSKTSAYLTPKEKLAQRIIDPKDPLKGKHASFESSINKTLGIVHILNDDEYNMMRTKGGY